MHNDAKFLHINHQMMRQAVQDAGANCVVPMLLTRRAILDFPDARLQANGSFVSIHDEANKIVLSFKPADAYNVGATPETKTTVGSYEETLQIFQGIGLTVVSAQEAKRETWQLDGAEIALVEWPWLEPFIEIEAGSEAEVKRTAMRLGLDWQRAVFGDVTAAYRDQYPFLPDEVNMSQVQVLRFNGPMPDLLQNKL